MTSDPWLSLVRAPPHGCHVAVLYRDTSFLSRSVAAWAGESLRAGGGAILVGTVTHAEMIRKDLAEAGVDVVRAERGGRLFFVDADWLMARFVLSGEPNAVTFHQLAGELVRNVREASRGEVRAWGEMVALLRMRGNAKAAQELEAMWTDLIDAEGIALLCSYEMEGDPTAKENGLLSDVLKSHTHVLAQPTSPNKLTATALVQP